MPKTISISKSGMTYLPQAVVEILGRKPCFIENTYALIMYNKRLDLSDVERSVEILLDHIRHKQSIQKKEKIRKETTS